jgi:hypothetical protein
MPSKDQIIAAASSQRATNVGQGRRKSSVGETRSPDVTRKQRKKSNVGLPSGLSHEAQMDDQNLSYPLEEEPATKKARLGEGPDSVSDLVPHDSRGERHRAPLMAMFLSDNPLSIPDILLQSQGPVDLNVNIVIDDQGHTALHWAAALARIDILRLLIAKGGNVKVVNFHSESALIRSVLVTNNYDNQTFPDLLNLLAPALSMLDADGRSVLHHIALVAGCRGRSPSSRYYMECTLEYIAKNGGNFSSLLDITDVHGDTAINLAARVGAHFLVGQLLDVGANPDIENLAGLNPSNFGFGNPDSANSAGLTVSNGCQYSSMEIKSSRIFRHRHLLMSRRFLIRLRLIQWTPTKPLVQRPWQLASFSPLSP